MVYDKATCILFSIPFPYLGSVDSWHGELMASLSSSNTQIISLSICASILHHILIFLNSCQSLIWLSFWVSYEKLHQTSVILSFWQRVCFMIEPFLCSLLECGLLSFAVTKEKHGWICFASHCILTIYKIHELQKTDNLIHSPFSINKVACSTYICVIYSLMWEVIYAIENLSSINIYS